MDSEFPIPSGRQLRAVRAWLNKTQPEFAKECGVGPTTLIAYENGNRKPLPSSLDMIARHLASIGVQFNRAGAIILPD